METIKKEKTVDAVKMMWDIRDKVSTETQNMTFEELKEYIKKRFKIASLGRWDDKVLQPIMHCRNCGMTRLKKTFREFYHLISHRHYHLGRF